MNSVSFRCVATVALILIVGAAIVVGGCGGSDEQETNATAPAQTSTAGSDAPKTLSATQTTRFDKANRSFVSAASLFLAKLNGCAAAKDRKACVRRAAGRAERAVTRSRDTVSMLASRVSGSCSNQLGDVRSRITDVTDVLGPMAEATQKGKLRNAANLGLQAQASLRSYAASTLIMQRAC